MDFNLNDEQELFVAGIRELMASENWEAYFAECDRDSVYPERFVKALADMGIDSLLIPEEHGGLDAGFVTLAAVWMELGRLGGTNLCAVPVAGRVQYLPARRHTRADRQDYGFPRHR